MGQAAFLENITKCLVYFFYRMRWSNVKLKRSQAESGACFHLIASGLIFRKCILENIWRLKNAGSQITHRCSSSLLYKQPFSSSSAAPLSSLPVLVFSPCIQCQGVQSNWKLILWKKGPVSSLEQIGEGLGMPLAAVCCQTGLPVWRKPLPSSLATQEYYSDQNNFKSLSLGPCMGSELPNLAFSKALATLHIKASVAATSKELVHTWRATACCSVHPHPALTASSHLTHADTICLRSLSHLTTTEVLSRIPWWPPQSGKFRNVNVF